MPASSGLESADDIVLAAKCFVFQNGKNLQVCKGADTVVRSEAEIVLQLRAQASKVIQLHK